MQVTREDGAPSEHAPMYRLQAETAYRIGEMIGRVLGTKLLVCVGSDFIRLEVQTRMNWPHTSQSLIPREWFDRRANLTPLPRETRSLLMSYVRRILTNGAEWVVEDHLIIGEEPPNAE